MNKQPESGSQEVDSEGHLSEKSCTVENTPSEESPRRRDEKDESENAQAAWKRCIHHLESPRLCNDKDESADT